MKYGEILPECGCRGGRQWDTTGSFKNWNGPALCSCDALEDAEEGGQREFKAQAQLCSELGCSTTNLLFLTKQTGPR